MDRERVAYIIGWLEGFSPVVWMVDEQKVASEVLAQYDDVVSELRREVLGYGEGDDSE